MDAISDWGFFFFFFSGARLDLRSVIGGEILVEGAKVLEGDWGRIEI